MPVSRVTGRTKWVHLFNKTLRIMPGKSSFKMRTNNTTDLIITVRALRTDTGVWGLWRELGFWGPKKEILTKAQPFKSNDHLLLTFCFQKTYFSRYFLLAVDVKPRSCQQGAHNVVREIGSSSDMLHASTECPERTGFWGWAMSAGIFQVLISM